ncbi:MAG: peptidoglycan -binding protein [Geminicoccaceae bacterium]
MARSRSSRHNLDIWPGFVDALSTLLLSVIFLLVVFVLGQFLLGQLLQGKDQAMSTLRSQVQDLTTKLGLEQDTADELKRTLSRLNADLRQAFVARDDTATQLETASAERDQLADRVVVMTREQAMMQRSLDSLRQETDEARSAASALAKEADAAKATVKTDKEQIELQLGQLVQLQNDIKALQATRADLEKQLADATGATGTERDRSKALEARLADAETRTVLAQKEIEQRDLRLEELTRKLTESEGKATSAGQSEAQALADVRRLESQIAALNLQLADLGALLGVRQGEIDKQKATIEDLGQRLNVALAAKVEELSQYKSEFFGRLRQTLGDREDIKIVGDRFVFQSEVLFGSGSADLEPGGQAELAKLAATLKTLTADLPEELPWVLQVDGHTDVRRIKTARFPSNWELSSARAISVAEFLIDQGIPPQRVAARGFAEFQPLDTAETEDAYRRNRRIEILLTTR